MSSEDGAAQEQHRPLQQQGAQPSGDAQHALGLGVRLGLGLWPGPAGSRGTQLGRRSGSNRRDGVACSAAPILC